MKPNKEQLKMIENLAREEMKKLCDTRFNEIWGDGYDNGYNNSLEHVKNYIDQLYKTIPIDNNINLLKDTKVFYKPDLEEGEYLPFVFNLYDNCELKIMMECDNEVCYTFDVILEDDNWVLGNYESVDDWKKKNGL